MKRIMVLLAAVVVALEVVTGAGAQTRGTGAAVGTPGVSQAPCATGLNRAGQCVTQPTPGAGQAPASNGAAGAAPGPATVQALKAARPPVPQNKPKVIKLKAHQKSHHKHLKKKAHKKAKNKAHKKSKKKAHLHTTKKVRHHTTHKTHKRRKGH